MIKTLSLVILLLFSGNLYAAKEIAITFDDAPRAAVGYLSGLERANKLINTLEAHHVEQVAFFAVSRQLDIEGVSRLKRYGQAGHVIGNHTHSHFDFNKLSLLQYQREFLRAHHALKDMPGFQPYFRFPYLREGNTQKKRNGMRAVLKDYGYTNAYITLNNYDWYIEKLFQQAIKENPLLDMKKVSDFYVNVLMESIEYYDMMAKRHLGRSPKHVLLLHEMDISALFVGDLIKKLREKGWKLITLEQAYKDRLSTLTINKVFKYNPGRIAEIARINGQTHGLWHETLDEDYLKERFQKEVVQ